MMISGVMVFNEVVDFDLLRLTIIKKFLKLPRFKQVLKETRGHNPKLFWEDDPAFNLDNHLLQVSLPEPGDEISLKTLASQLSSTPLDNKKALWQMHFIPNYNHGSALLCRLHHSIADGMALVYVILSITDLTRDGYLNLLEAPPPPPVPISSRQRFLTHAKQEFQAARRRAEERVYRGADLVGSPEMLVDYGYQGLEAAEIITNFLLLPPDPDTSLRGTLTTEKRVAWSGAIQMKDVKRIRRKFGGTVNDVMMTIFSGAIRKYLQDQGEPVDEFTLRATVPVNLRPLEKMHELGNQIGAMFISLPINIADPAERLIEIEHRTDGSKNSLEPPVFYRLLNVLGMTPKNIANQLIKLFSSRATLVMTNVRGPTQTLFMAGSPINEIMFWVPQTGRLGVGISIISYADHVFLGVISDSALVPEPEKIIQAFCEEFTLLRSEAQETDRVPSIQDAMRSLDDAVSSLDKNISSAYQEIIPERK
jgi:WS/DGAT/MGAT family acyltransferase